MDCLIQKGTRLVMEEDGGDTSRLSSDSKETSSFSVVCEGVTAKVFAVLGS